jgi:hypothetical protein
MARKSVTRSLPDLAECLCTFQGFGPQEHHGERLTELLRKVIEVVRQPQDVPFYSVAAVARHVGVSTRTVNQCYRKLAEEGLLCILRGSKTLVRGRRLQPQHPILGVVGIPVYLPGFVIGSELRAFYVHLEQALRRHHFVADLIFFKQDEESSPDLTERILEHELDVLLWINPAAASRTTIQTALDGGISVVLCVDGRTSLPRRQYVYNSERALTEAVSAWRRDGIRSVSVWQHVSRGERSAQVPVLAQVLRRAGMPITFRELTNKEASHAAEEVIRHPDEGVVLPTHQGYEALANEFPAAVQQLLATNRVLLMQGSLYHPAFEGGTLLTDVIAMPVAPMADRIARDIGEGRADTVETLTTFHAHFHPRLNLGTVSREI